VCVGGGFKRSRYGTTRNDTKRPPETRLLVEDGHLEVEVLPLQRLQLRLHLVQRLGPLLAPGSPAPSHGHQLAPCSGWADGVAAAAPATAAAIAAGHGWVVVAAPEHGGPLHHQVAARRSGGVRRALHPAPPAPVPAVILLLLLLLLPTLLLLLLRLLSW
jgi:hypothetical protein